MKLTDLQWEILKPLFETPIPEAGRGRPRVNARSILDGILWILRSGARWEDLPPRYPSRATCHRRFQEWVEDGTFSSAKKRGLGVGKTKRGKGCKLMAIADRHGLPLGIWIGSASPHEVTLVETTLDNLRVDEAPEKLIGDKAYDSDKLGARLDQERGIELIAPHKSNRKKPKTQDGRKPRRYRHRWRIERLFAWLQSFRRLVTRYENTMSITFSDSRG